MRSPACCCGIQPQPPATTPFSTAPSLPRFSFTIFFYDFSFPRPKRKGGGVGWRRIYGGAFSFSTKLSSATKKLDGDKTTHSQKKSHSKLQGRKTRPNIFLGCLIFISPFIFQRECSSCNVLLFEMNSYSF